MLKFPADFLNSLANCPGFEKDSFIASHEAGEQVTAVRINTQKNFLQQLEFPFSEHVPWNADGYYLPERPSFTLDPFFHAGAYYVQEASSMFLAEALRQTCNLKENLTVLDLCAAPGGKSTLIQSLISEDSLLLSNEVIKSRVNILSENIAKWGAANVVVSNNDSSDFSRLKNFFDVIVVDAPCSGSGLFRKDEAAMREWSLKAVEFCSQRQQRILANVLPALKQNGILIYSTCSYSLQENEAITNWLMQQKNMASLELSINPLWNIVASKAEGSNAIGYRFYPNKLKDEGFYMAAFRKNEDIGTIKIAVGNKFNPLSKNEINLVQQYTDIKGDIALFKFNNDVFAFPQKGFAHLQQLQQVLYLKKAGVQVGALLRNELLPHHELALATQIAGKFPVIEAEKSIALDYLRRKDIRIETAVKGWALLKYKSLGIGFIKILPNRANNYYPKEWRILNK